VFGEAVSCVVERVDVPKGDHHPLAGLRIVFLSDLHWNGADHVLRCVRPELLDDVMEKVLAIAPDLVLLGGDYVEWSGSDAKVLCTRWLSRLVARCGVFATLGNHDQRAPGARD
jgi:predicted MPP superfamily phosphohydrolase